MLTAGLDKIHQAKSPDPDFRNYCDSLPTPPGVQMEERHPYTTYY